MPTQQGNTSVVKILKETVPGVTPAAALKRLKTTGFNINANVATTTSATIRYDRAVDNLERIGKSSEGSINAEVCYAEYDDLIAGALGGTWSTAVNMSATTISAASGDNSFNDSANGFSTANILPGMWIRVGGFVATGNNRLWKVVSVTTSKIVVSGGTVTPESAGATVTVKGSSVRNGIVKDTFTIEQEYPDITQFCATVGAVVNTMNLTSTSEALLTGSFGFIGRDTTWSGATVGTGTDIAQGTNPIMSSAANVGTIYIDGVAATGVYFKQINLDTTNNSRGLTAIGYLPVFDINHGSFGATLATQTFFQDRTLLEKYLNGTPVSLSYSFTDSAGATIVVDVPYGKFSAGSTSGQALNSDVMVDLTLTALNSPTLGYMLQISRIPA